MVTRYCVHLLVGVLCLCCLNTYGTPELEAYGSLEQINDASISPNGELIAYRRTESDCRDFLLVFSLKKQKIIRAIDVKDIDPQWLYFSDDNFIQESTTRIQALKAMVEFVDSHIGG